MRVTYPSSLQVKGKRLVSERPARKAADAFDLHVEHTAGRSCVESEELGQKWNSR